MNETVHIRSIQVDRIAPDPEQPRSYFDQESIDELARSMADPFRWRLSRIGMVLPPNVGADELMMISGALKTWEPTIGETDMFKWWVGDWRNALNHWNDRYRHGERLLRAALRQKKRGAFSTGESDELRKIAPEDRVLIAHGQAYCEAVAGGAP